MQQTQGNTLPPRPDVNRHLLISVFRRSPVPQGPFLFVTRRLVRAQSCRPPGD
jgi:hypothetical protein